MLKRLLSVFLCMLMACALICTSALAAEDETVLPENDPDNGPAQIYIDEKPFGKMGDAVMIDSTVYVPMRNLCLSYGGGGHRNAGTCQLENDVVDKELPAIIAALNG